MQDMPVELFLQPTIGNKRIIEISKDIEGTLDHKALAKRHGITIHNLKYLLRKMTDMGIIEIKRTRTHEGVFGPSNVRLLKIPKLIKEQ